MKLNLGERFTTLGILPKEGDISTLRITRDLQAALAPTEDEFKEFEIKQEDGHIKWNQKGANEKEITIGEKAQDIVISSLRKMDKDKKMMAIHISIWEKFIGDDK